MSCMLITRADDAGSSHAANQAIREAIQAGFIRNVSVMAVGPEIEEAAAFLRDQKSVCLGLHAVLNSEWDGVKWTPASPLEQIPSLLDETGNFYQRPALFPAVLSPEEMCRELDAQLSRLHKLGLHPVYVDSHMYFERQLPALQQAFTQWACRHGLIDHNLFCSRFPVPRDQRPLAERMEEAARNASVGPCLHVFHPACPTEEMLRFEHEGMPARQVQQGRGEEYHFVTDGIACQLCRTYRISPVTYLEAASLLEKS